jgi:PEP-CTERM motif
MKHNRKFLMTLMGATLMLAGTARASFVLDFQSVTGGGPFSFLYNADFGSNSNTEELVAGDFTTLYDIVGFMSATAPVGFTMTNQLLGITPSAQSPTDSASLMNVTFTYTGTTITADHVFTGFTVVSTAGSTQAGFTSGQDMDVRGGNLGDTTGTTVPLAAVAGVPEPATMGLLGVSLVLLGAMRLRPKVRRSPEGSN